MIYIGPGFLPSTDMAPTPSLSPVNKLDRRNTGRLRKRDNWLTGDGGGRTRVGEEPNHAAARKLGPL